MSDDNMLFARLELFAMCQQANSQQQRAEMRMADWYKVIDSTFEIQILIL